MARSRRGSFGLQPRVAPNVTGQIVALAREYVAKRDALIMDAWRNGGTFEGKKATDDMVLAYWRDREKGLDQNDPDYEQAKDQVLQLTYAVAQSKADVQHAQGKLSDGAYAQFFLNWAKKVPANSEFYRTLQKDAAQLIESAKNKARADGERARTEAFNAFVKSTTDHEIAIGDAMTRDLDALAKQTGLSVTGNGDELLALLTRDVQQNPGAHRYLLDTIKKGDPHWDGNLTEGYFSQHIKAAASGYDKIADRAQKGGFVSAYANATQGEANMSGWAQNVRVWPIATSYSQAENAYLRVWNDPNASQMDKQFAAATFSSRLSALAATQGIDAGSKTMIEADAQRLLGKEAGDSPSFGTAMLGRPGVSPEMTAKIGAWTQMSDLKDQNPLAFSYASVDEHGQFDPTGKGPLGIVPAGSIPPGAQAVVIPGFGGKAVMAMVMPHAVYVSDPNNPSASPKLAGYQISYNVGGKSVALWGYKDSKNQSHWSLTSPVAEGASTTVDSKGDVYVTPSAGPASDPIARAEQLDKQFGTNLADQLRQQQKNGAPLGGVTQTISPATKKGATAGGQFELKYDNGVFTATQTTTTLDPKTGKVLQTVKTPLELPVSQPGDVAFSPSRLAAGDVPGVTYSSPLQASVTAAAATQNSDQVSRFASDPEFQQAFLRQTMETLHITNPLDGRVADAWKKVTTPTAPNESGSPDDRMARGAANLRSDLSYPGEQPQAANQGTLNINFGKSGELRLPGLPSYLGNKSADFSGVANAAGGLLGGLSTLLPGLGGFAPAAQPGAGVGSPAVTPTATPSAPTLTAITTGTATPPPNLLTKPPAPPPTPYPGPKRA